MNSVKNTVIVILAVFIGLIMVFSFLPTVVSVTYHEEYEQQEGAGWIRMNYITRQTSYNVAYSILNDTIEINDGFRVQTGETDSILYADSNLSVWTRDFNAYLLGTVNNVQVFKYLGSDFTIKRNSSGVSVIDGSGSGAPVYSFGLPSWAYVPVATGKYTFFQNGIGVRTDSSEFVTTGSFAGIGAYNDTVAYDVNLDLQVTSSNDVIDNTGWYESTPQLVINPGVIDPRVITPVVNPSIVNPNPIVRSGSYNATVGSYFDTGWQINYTPDPDLNADDYYLRSPNYGLQYQVTFNDQSFNYRIYGTPTSAGTFQLQFYYTNADLEAEDYDSVYVNISAPPSYTHTITYDGNGASSGSVANTVVTDTNSGSSNVTLAPNGFLKNGYNFVGWSVNGVTYQPGATVPVPANGSVTAVAQWDLISYTHTIIYDGNGASSGSVANTVVTDVNAGSSNVTLAPNGFLKDGYDFVGWYFNGVVYQPGNTIPVPANGSVTAVAQWELSTYTHTITYDGNGASSGSVANTVVTDNNGGNTNVTLAPNGFLKDGYDFVGWSVNGVTYQPGATVPVPANGSVTAVAQWTATIYHSGPWDYLLSGDDAIIVGYTQAPPSVLTVPSTLDGYTVITIGDGVNPIIDNSTVSSNWELVITSGPSTINNNAFDGCTYLTGTLVIPDSIKSIGQYAFRNTGLTGTLVIPGSINELSDGAFYGVDNVTSLAVISNAVPGSNTFYMAGVTEVLDLSINDYATSRYGLPVTAVVQDYILSIGYLAPTELAYTVVDNSATSIIIRLLPLVIMIGLVVWFIFKIKFKRDDNDLY